MSKGGGSQTVTQQTELPQWVQNAAQTNLNAAYRVAQNMAGPYQGPMVAGMTNGQLADIAGLQNNIGSTNPAFAAAQSAAAGLTGYNPNQVTAGTINGGLSTYTPDQVNAGTLAGTNLSSYTNPYTQNVINAGLQGINTQLRQSLNNIGDQAIKTGAFGGSRQGVTEGIANAAAALQAGNLASQLQAQNFSQAQQAAQNDLNRNLQAQLANQSAGLQGQGLNLQSSGQNLQAQLANLSSNLQAQLANQQAGMQGAGLNLQAANTLGGLAQQGQQSFLTGLGAALTGQGAVQNQNQNDINAQIQAYQAAQQYPVQQLMLPLQALGMTPYGQTTTQTSPASSNGLLTGFGALGTGVGILGGVNSLMGGGTSLLSALGLISDRRDKTDIKKLGKDPQSGLDMYSYRYKDDPKSYPKVVGPMAQDIEDKYPGAVREIGGHKVVNLGFG